MHLTKGLVIAALEPFVGDHVSADQVGAGLTGPLAGKSRLLPASADATLDQPEYLDPLLQQSERLVQRL